MKVFEKITRGASALRKKFVITSKKNYKRGTVFIKARPLGSFFIVLGLLFLIIIVGQIFQKKATEQTKKQPVKSVTIYSVGTSPKATFQAKVEKSGVVKIMAQTSGVVQSVLVTEGDNVDSGQQLISLSSNYQGGNAASVQRQIAQSQYQNVLDTFGTQKDLINNQRDVATTSADNAQKMRDIARQAVDQTNSLIDTNQSQLDQMNQNLQDLLATNQTSSNISTLQGSISQLQGGINQLREANRSADYASNNENDPAKLANLQKDITLKQLDIQEKGIDLNKQVSQLQLNLAYINEATMFPASPFAGTVERVSVHEGQLVTPGTVLAIITSPTVKATAILTVPERIAKVIALGEPSELTIGDKKVAVTPYYVSSQATDGQLYSVFYDIPEDYQDQLSDSEYIAIGVPVDTAKTTAADPLLPIDAVYQTQNSAFILIVKNNKAQTKTVKLGKILGDYVEVLSGLTDGDEVILDRNVISGDKITIK